MATFQILEDDENRAQFRRSNRIADNGGVSKKNYDGKGVLQPCNRIEQDSKRLKLTCKENVAPKITGVVEKKVVAPVIQKIEDANDFQDELLKFEEQDFQIKSKEENGFPLSLLNQVEYRDDIWKYLLHMEQNCQKINPNYMAKQSSVTWNTRTILVDWLASVSDEYKLLEETFHLGVNYIDRFMSRISVVREKFQLLGASAMMIAGKVEEIYPIETQEWSYLTGDSFEVRQILKMEQLILKVLKFGLQSPTIFSFLEHLCTEFNVDVKTKHLAMFLSELVLLEGAEYLEHVPSKLAAASIALARHTLSKQPIWPQKMKKVSGYSLKHLSPVVQRQNQTFRESPMKKEQAIQTKYMKDKYNNVALIKPKFLNMDEFDDSDD